MAKFQQTVDSILGDPTSNFAKLAKNVNFITPPKNKGVSKELTVSGRKGKFIFDVPPQFMPGIGGGKTPMYLFQTKSGETYFHRLESDKQGGRWEDSGQIEEYDMMKRDPQKILDMWGNSDVAKKLIEAVQKDVPFHQLPRFLKDVNTHRQISGD